VKIVSNNTPFVTIGANEVTKILRELAWRFSIGFFLEIP
jgi:hypothetical protein